MLPLVLHVLPVDLPRGAQRYARAMRDALDANEQRHRTLTLFRSDVRVLDADIKLEQPRRWSSRLGIDPAVTLSLRRALLRHEPALVVAHGSEPLKYLLAARPRADLVYYKIGISTSKSSRGARRAFHAFLLSRARIVAGVSQDCLDEARDVFGVASSKLRLIPNGRDPRVFTPREAPHTSTEPTLTFVGHLTPTKRPGRFLELVKQLRQAGLAFRALMIGDGPLLRELQRTAPALGVEVLGRRDDIPALLRETDVMAFTSVPDSEGMPGVYIEAGLSGIPVVTTDVPGARSVILDGQSGYVVGTHDMAALVGRTHSLLTNAELRRQMGAMARTYCEKELSLEKSVERWRALLSELLVVDSPRRVAS